MKGNIGLSLSTLNPLAKKFATPFGKGYLLEAGGELLGVFVYGSRQKARVYKLNYQQQYTIWINGSIGRWWRIWVTKQCTLLLLYICFGKKGGVKGMENKIYISKFYGKSCVYYSLETNKYHSVATGDFCSETSLNSILYTICCATYFPRFVWHLSPLYVMDGITQVMFNLSSHYQQKCRDPNSIF